MANIDLGNLTRYNGKIKQYVEDKYLSKNTANWQMTEKAGAVTCYPVPDTELEPIVDFSFKEVPPASGDKSLTNPSIVTGISSITVTQCETTSVDETQYIVNLDNTYYGGSVNLATGMMTVTKEFVTLNTVNASDGIAGGNAVLRAWPESLGMRKPTNDGSEVCEELPRATSGTGVNRFFVGRPIDGNCPIYVVLNPSLLDFSGAVDSSNPTAIEVRNAGVAYLNAHPLHMVLSLETPYAVQLTPIQIKSLTALDKNIPRLNTLYTDADSIQVGYQKHPARTAYELENAILALEGGE